MTFVRLVAATIALGLVANTHVTSAPPPKPVIVINRVSVGRYHEPAPKSPLLFVLIIGSDVREGDPAAGRSDSLHLLALNTHTGRGTLVGIPRDSWINIPGHGTDKINASLDFGGPALTVQTVSQLSGIPIQYWALIDFSRFRKLVDALGGLDVNVPYPMHDIFSGAQFEPGRKHMNGEQALAFARDRKTLPQGDFDRSFNQGRLLVAALAKFKKETGSPLRLFTYLSKFRSLVRSNVPTGELIKLAEIGRRADASHITNLVLPGAGGSAGGASVVFLAPGAQDVFAKIKDDGVL